MVNDDEAEDRQDAAERASELTEQVNAALESTSEDEIDTAWILESSRKLLRELDDDWGAPPEPIAIHEIIAELDAQLGATLVSALSGTQNRREAGETHPDAATETRLRLAHQLWRQVAESNSPDVARAFFTGSNPELGDDTLITALREDRFREAWVAVRILATDT